MKTSMFSAMTAALAGLYLPTALANGYWYTCNRISLWEGNRLNGCCDNGHGTWFLTELALDQCVTNRDGQLVAWQDGNFGASCRGCSMLDRALLCECGDGRGGWPITWLDLNEFVYNQGGILGCFDRSGLVYGPC